MTTFRFSAALVCIGALCGCSGSIPGRQLACDDMPGMLSTATTAVKQHDVVSQCIHKWGARFALAPGTNSEIAKAVVYRCGDAIFDYYQLLARETNNLTDTDKRASDEEFREMALMRVVQQRAGQCSLKAGK